LFRAVARSRKNKVRRQPLIVLYVLAMIAVVVVVDVLSLRHLFLERLIVNIGIVAVFLVVYLRFLKRA
jgi:hypothetical protein